MMAEWRKIYAVHDQCCARAEMSHLRPRLRCDQRPDLRAHLLLRDLKFHKSEQASNDLTPNTLSGQSVNYPPRMSALDAKTDQHLVPRVAEYGDSFPRLRHPSSQRNKTTYT